MAAAEKGYQAGADAWELDVQVTRDGVPVLLHDRSLLRTTDVAVRYRNDPRAESGFLVESFTWEEVRTLDAGSWFLNPQGGHRTARFFGTQDELSEADRVAMTSGQIGVPRLDEALRFTCENNWLVNVELKPQPGLSEILVAAVIETIDRVQGWDRLWISSFDHPILAELRNRKPEAALGVLVAQPLLSPARYVREIVGGRAYHPSLESVPFDRETPHWRHWSELRTAGIATFVYTVNDASSDGQAEQLRQAGATGMFTDDPSALLGLWTR